MNMINPGVIIVSWRGQVVCICTRLGPSRLHWSDSDGGWGQLPPTHVGAPPEREEPLSFSPSQSVLCSVQSLAECRTDRTALLAQLSPPTQQPRATTRSASKFTAKTRRCNFFTRLQSRACFWARDLFPRSPPLCSTRHFFACASAAAEVLLVGVGKGIRMCIKVNNADRGRAAAMQAGIVFESETVLVFWESRLVLFLSVFIGSYVLSFCSGAYCTKPSFLGAVACSSDDDDFERQRAVSRRESKLTLCFLDAL